MSEKPHKPFPADVYAEPYDGEAPFHLGNGITLLDVVNLLDDM